MVDEGKSKLLPDGPDRGLDMEKSKFALDATDASSRKRGLPPASKCDRSPTTLAALSHPSVLRKNQGTSRDMSSLFNVEV